MIISLETFPNVIPGVFSVTNKAVERLDAGLVRHVKELLLRDLARAAWTVDYGDLSTDLRAPSEYDKDVVRSAMASKREEAIKMDRHWISNHIAIARANLASGEEVLRSEIVPAIEECQTQDENDLFRTLRYYWSSPPSDYVGRRMRFIVRDAGLPSRPVIGIAALGSSVIHIPERDDWVGWSQETRSRNIGYAMDAYVVGALPPYSYLLGGKLISYLLASNEVRELYRNKYAGAKTRIQHRELTDLACIFTTSLYGRSSQYSRIRFEGRELWNMVGFTHGYGTQHLTAETLQGMRDIVKQAGFSVGNEFGDGPSWNMRLVKKAASLLGIDGDELLQHSFRRGIYTLPLANNTREFLCGKAKSLEYFDYPATVLAGYWKDRWLLMRRQEDNVVQQVRAWQPSSFVIE
ncbi:MAG: Druantia anti-phage system protein DruA [Candidatus Cryosericum sp.]